ncbi:MAG TPA: hypothetical protein VJY62_11000, partial [Bacteroidia bacterium]|nr:hypothetical protein [Bacteroidia bacterium]
MKTKIYVFVILLLSFITASAQSPNWQWAKKGGGNGSEIGLRIYTAANGTSFVTGTFTSVTMTIGFTLLTNTVNTGSSNDIYVASYDVSGNVLWAKSAGGTSSDEVYGISGDANGNCYVTGKFWSDSITFGSFTLLNEAFQDNDLFIVKYDASGNVLWAKRAGGIHFDAGYAISSDAAGNSFVTGSFEGDSISFDGITLLNTGSYDVHVVKYDPSGNVVWAKSGIGSSAEYGQGISTDGFGNCYVTGIFGSDTLTFDGFSLYHTGFGADIFLLKYNASGVIQWAKSAGGQESDNVTGISTDVFGNSNLTGHFNSQTLTFGSTILPNYNTSKFNIFNVKYDASGNVAWAKSAGDTANEFSNGIVTDITGNSYITGHFAGPFITFGSTVLLNAGGTCAGSPCADMFVTKYDASGNVVWAKKTGGTSNEQGMGIGLDGTGHCYVAGSFDGSSLLFGSIYIS